MWMKYFALLALLVATRAYEVPDAVRTLGLEEASFDQLPTPEELVFKLSEEDFEDYLSYYLFKKAQPAQEIEVKDVRASCSVTVASLSEPQPIYASGGALLAPNGNTGSIAFSDGQVVALACPGSGLSLSSASTTPASANVVCSGGTAFTGSGWFSGTASFASIGCTSHPSNVQTRAGTCVDGGSIITIGLAAGGATHTIITSCFHESKAEVFYTIFDQNPDNAQYMSGVARPSFGQGSWFPGLSVDTLYTQVSQTAAFNTILGSGMATQYINTTYFLARGHLAAKTDFVFSPAQRATFSFVNTAPQWQPFNGGNWNTLEQNLRTRIGAAGSRTKIYTGTWGNLELKDSSGVFRKLYLSPSTTQIPVPLWYYKVVHEPSTNRATAFLGLNNPHVTLAEARALAFCTDVCTGSTAFSWLNWQATNIGLGFSICCQVADFRRTVTQLPSFTTSGIFS